MFQAIRLSKITGTLLAVLLLSGCGGGGKATNGGLDTMTGDKTHSVDLPAAHDLANWLAANPGGMVTVPAGERRDMGGVRFSCPLGGGDCAVAVTSADGATMVSSTGGMATAEGHSAILNRILRSADTLLVSHVIMARERLVDSDFHLRFEASCGGMACTWDTVWLPFGGQRLPFARDLDEPDTIMPYDLTDEAMDWPAATETHRGVLLVSEMGIHSIGDLLPWKLTGYGGWLYHNLFIVAHRTIPDDDIGGSSAQLAMSIGDATGTNPTSVTGSATWSGVVVGTDVSATASQFHQIRGDADITIADLSDPALDVAFTNISDVDAGQRRADMTWDDVSLTDGGFGTGSDGNSIEGKFYGPNHEEVGGIFERDQVIGAFGAKSDTMLPSTPTVRPVDNGEGPMRVEPAKVRSLTGSGAPTFFRGDVLPTINRISQRANSLLASDVIDFSQDPPVRGQTTCSGIRCEATAEKSGYYAEWEWEVEEIRVSHQGTIDAVAEHRGVSLAQVVDRHEAPFENESLSFAVYGGWLDHSYFWVSAEFDRQTRSISEDVDAVSIGLATGTNPVSGGASWHGVMVGRDVSATVARGNAFQGNAEVTIADFANPRVGVAFTSIKDLSTGGSRGDMTWSGISLTNGGFATGSDGNSIEGRFYGPNHEEAGGIFERDQVIGAFGAKRP